MPDPTHRRPADSRTSPRDERKRVRTRRRRILEGYLAAVPIAFMIALATTLLARRVIDVLFAGAFVVLLSGSIIVPILVVIDAQETRANVSIRRLAVAGFLLPVPTLIYYFRSDPAPTPPGRFAGVAGVFLVVGVVGWIGYFAGELVLTIGIVSGTGIFLKKWVVLTLGGLGLLLYAPFPIAVYADTKYVRVHGRGWDPSPALRYLATLAFYSPLGLLVPVYVLYHLVRRRQALVRAGRDR